MGSEVHPVPPTHFLSIFDVSPPAQARHRRCSPRLLMEHEKHTALEQELQVLMYVSKPYPSSIVASSPPSPTPQSSQLVGWSITASIEGEAADETENVEEEGLGAAGIFQKLCSDGWFCTGAAGGWGGGMDTAWAGALNWC